MIIKNVLGIASTLREYELKHKEKKQSVGWSIGVPGSLLKPCS